VLTLRTLLSRLRALGRARQLDGDLRREIASHLDEATDEFVRRGYSPAEARRAALRMFGGVAQAEERYRELLSFQWLEHLRRDVRHAMRTVRRSPGFSSVVVIVLAIGTGAIVSVFALVNRIVLRPLPYPQSQQLVVVRHSVPGLNLKDVGLSSGLYFHYLEHARSFDGIGLYSDTVLNLRPPGASLERIQVTYASAALFQVLGVRPELGRLFTDEDGRPGFLNMKWTVPVLLAHDFWVDRFGGDPAVVGRILTISDNPRVVVGVMPAGFTFPREDTAMWMLLEPPRRSSNFARRFNSNAVARMRPGVTTASAQAELARILPSIAGVYEDATPARLAELRLAPIVTPLKSAVIGDVPGLMWTLLGGMGLLLLIAAANTAGLFVVRAEHRRREVAVRVAIGADRHHIVRLFVCEALVLTIAAGVLGLLIARSLLWGVVVLAPIELPRASEIGLDAVTVLFTVAVAVVTALFYGVLSVRAQRGCSAIGLADRSARGATRNDTYRTRHPFVALQVALALSLMIGSALMVKTYRNLARTALGFTSDRLLTAEVALPSRKASQHARIYDALVEAVGRLPGVQSAAAASFVPLTPGEHVFPVQAGAAPVPFKFFTPGYFQTMRTQIADGEGLGARAHSTVPYPVLVSAALARRLSPDGRAVGKLVRRLNEDGSLVTLGHGPVPPFTIVGVVGDVRETALRREPTEIVYVPVFDQPVEQSIVPTNMTLVVRTAVPPLALAAAVRDAIGDVDPDLTVGQVRTMDAIVRAARAREAFVGVLLLLAATVSLFLGVVGVYGSVAHVVTDRTREIGIRIALGARPPEVLRMVVAGSMNAVIVGSLLGVVLALQATGMLGALLFGVQPRDPVIFAAVTGVLLLSAGTSALVAGRRAARVAPLVAMRSE